MDALRWGILSTGAIAQRFASELTDPSTGRLVAMGSRAGPYPSYEEVLANPDVDAVYIATPHPMHARWAIAAVEAGKHVLCEKPLTMNEAEAETVIDAARKAGVFFMEAFMYRCHPQTKRLREVLQWEGIGEIRVIEAVHSFKGSSDPAGRLLAPELGGGAILDVGCYCMSGARLAAGEEPSVVTGVAYIGPTGVDEWAVASLAFPSGAVAHLSTGVQVDQPAGLRIYGSRGRIEVPAPWLPGIDGAPTTAILVNGDVVEVESDRGLYGNEALHVFQCIAAGLTESPDVSWDDTLGNMAALDRWRSAVGVRYPGD